MTKIGNLKLGKSPRIALVLCSRKNSAFIKKAKSQGADLLEIRIDQFKNVEQDYILKTIAQIKGNGLPIIATIRSKKEGGKYLAESKRLKLFEAIIPLIDAIDIELSSQQILNNVVEKAHQKRKTVIISYHNFKETPNKGMLEKLIKKIKIEGGDIVKIACLAKNRKDLLGLMEFTLEHRNKNLVTISMGETGAISRVLFPFLGSLFSYAYLGTPSAPGQLPLKVLHEELSRFKKLSGFKGYFFARGQRD